MGLFNTDRLSKSERKRLRELRRGQKAKGFKKKSHLGLTSHQSRDKRKIEAKRRKARGEDFGKAVLAATAVGAGAVMAPAAVTSTVAPTVTTTAPVVTTGGSTAAATPTALTTGQKILQGVKKVKKVTDTAKDVVDIVNTTKDIAGVFRGGEEEQQVPSNYYNPLAGDVGGGYIQPSSGSNAYDAPVTSVPEGTQMTQNLMSAINPNAYMDTTGNMAMYDQNIRQSVLQADNAQAQNLAGLGATLKSGGRIKKSLGDRYKMGGRIKAKQKY